MRQRLKVKTRKPDAAGTRSVFQGQTAAVYRAPGTTGNRAFITFPV